MEDCSSLYHLLSATLARQNLIQVINEIFYFFQPKQEERELTLMVQLLIYKYICPNLFNCEVNMRNSCHKRTGPM